MSTPITIRFKLHGQDADLLRSLQAWIRDNDYPEGPADGLPYEPDEIARRQFVNFLYSSVQKPAESGVGSEGAQTGESTHETVDTANERP